METEELLQITGNQPWIAYPHTLAMRLDFQWQPFLYLVEVSRLMASQIYAGNGRMLVCLHPRIGKTTLLIEKGSVWFLNLYPEKTIIFCSYSEEFAADRARIIRNLIKDYRNVLRVKLAQDCQGTSRFYTTEGGGFISLGIGSGLSGLPCDLLAVDDIYSSFAKAQSKSQRDKVRNWFNDAYMRLQPNGSILVTGARTHENDLQGYLIEQHPDDWAVLSYPALSVGPEQDPLGRQENEALCPVLYGRKKLLKIKAAVGPMLWAAEYMQKPLPETGLEGASRVFPDTILDDICSSYIEPLALR